MFTGIVQDVGQVVQIDTSSGDWRIRIRTGLDLRAAPRGASMCCAGCCLTIIARDADWFDVQVSRESLDKTTIGTWSVGTDINLEPSLKLGDELGGHFVFGHIDGQAEVISINQDGDSHRLTLRLPPAYASFLAPKGTIALDGVSLTINTVNAADIGLAIIPHSWAHTTLKNLRPGSQVNFEIDMLARYVARHIHAFQQAA